MKKLTFFLLFAIFVWIVLALCSNDFVRVQVEFDKMSPPKNRIDAYYNGFKVGAVKKIYPCEHSKGACIDVLLDRRIVFLPENIDIKMKQKRIHEKKYEDYIEIEYPKNPSYIELKDGAKLKGKLARGFHNYLNEEVSYDEMEQIKQAFLDGAENFEKATSLLVSVLSNVDDLVENSSGDVKSAIKNLKTSTRNLNKISNKINSSVDEEILRNIILNVDSSVENFSGTGYQLKQFSERINSAPNLDKIDSIAKNADKILSGVKCALSKPFGGLRLIFGRSVK